jgi:PAS domain S-box-containing protein
VAIGYDMATEPVRRSAMERACDTGRPAASGPVTLVQEIDEKKQAGFLVYLPVYGGGRAPQTVDERRAALAGFVYGPFRVDDLMRGILGGGTHPGIAFRIFAGPEAAPSLLYRSDEAPGSLAESTLTAVVALDVAGYPWSIRFSALPAFADGSRKGESVLLFLVGVAVSLVLFGVSRAQVRARAAAERTAADLRRSEDARRESEERARLILDSALDAVITIDREGRITGWNPQAARLFGWPREEAVGRLLADTIIPSAHRDAHWRGLARYLATGETRVLGRRIEVDALARDGREFAVELAITPVVSGGAVGFSAFLRDISERKAAEDEIRALNTDLTRRVEERTADLTAANRELEAFSYSVSHDLRAPLRAIDGFSRIVLDEYGTGLPDDARGLLHRVIEGAHRMDALINDLLAFSRLVHQPLVRTEIALEPLIKDVLVELGASGHADVMVGDVALCVGDPRLLRQVYLNLLSNALKFTRRRAAAAIEIGSRSADGDTVYFVRDNGVGFDMKNAQKLFGVFQRLHRAEEYEGTGVGLAIVQRIVHRHGGRIWAEAMVDRGATFYFTLGGAAGS